MPAVHVHADIHVLHRMCCNCRSGSTCHSPIQGVQGGTLLVAALAYHLPRCADMLAALSEQKESHVRQVAGQRTHTLAAAAACAGLASRCLADWLAGCRCDRPGQAVAEPQQNTVGVSPTTAMHVTSTPGAPHLLCASKWRQPAFVRPPQTLAQNTPEWVCTHNWAFFLLSRAVHALDCCTLSRHVHRVTCPTCKRGKSHAASNQHQDSDSAPGEPG